VASLAAPQRRSDDAYDAPIPLGGLAPGRYLVEIEATSGAEASRVYWGLTITN
jgi:hypothetical protein